MSDSWKGPSAVIGIIGLLVSIGIFVYQAWEERNDKAKKDLIEIKKSADEKRAKDSIANAAGIAEQKAMSKIQIEKRILWIERHLPIYDSTMAIMKKSLRKSTIRDDYARERLADTINPPSENSRQDLNEMIGYYIKDLRDSARLQNLIDSLKNQRLILSDSLRLYYK